MLANPGCLLSLSHPFGWRRTLLEHDERGTADAFFTHDEDLRGTLGETRLRLDCPQARHGEP